MLLWNTFQERVVMSIHTRKHSIYANTFIIISLLILLFLSTAQAIERERKVALIIGNGEYSSSPLSNPVNDANDIADALQDCGFTIIKKTNATRNQMREAVRRFGREINQGAIGLFYYAGHGIQVNGENFLVPIGAEVVSEDEVEDECLKVSSILRKMETAGNRLNIIILDACRNNPFGRSFRSSNLGLAKMDAPTGSLLAYATAPGSVAADGSQRNGLYTSKLLKYMRKSDLEIGRLFRLVRTEVVRDSGNKQVPWESSSLMGDFYFIKSRGIAVQGDLGQVNQSGKLYIQTHPADAMVTFLNHQQKFHQGMALGADHYEIEVTREGYQPTKKWIKIKEGERTDISVRLSRLKNFVLDGNFADFGKPGGPWGTGAYSNYGIWWNSKNAKSKAKKILLKPENFLYMKYGIQTALYMSNTSPTAPHVFGTTAQKIKVTPNQKYTLNLWALSKNLKRTGAVNILVDPTWAKRLIYIKGGNTKWTQYSATFNAGDANYLDLRILFEDVGQVWMTGLSIYEANQ